MPDVNIFICYKIMLYNRIFAVCRDWMYGENCKSSCACVTLHTDTCDATTGECFCKSGWTGSTCENDIDECNIKGICQNYSSCENSDGSYVCTCDTGYIETENATCQGMMILDP